MDDFGFDGPRRPLVWRILLAPFIMLGRLFERFAGGDELAGQRGLLGWLYLIFVAPFAWTFSALGQLLVGWSSSRQATTFFLGLPALLFALVTVSIYSYGRITSQRMADSYKIQLQRAKAGNDYENAEVLLNKLMRIDEEDLSERRLEKVALLRAQGKDADAYRLLLELTNPENPESVGNAEAHTQLAQFVTSEEFQELNGFEEMEPAEKQRFVINTDNQARNACEIAVAAGAKGRNEEWVKSFLYAYHIRRKQYDEAKPHIQDLHRLNSLKFSIPHYAFFTQVVPLKDLADSVAAQDARDFSKLIKEKPNVPLYWRDMARFNVIRKDFQQALNDLQSAQPADREGQAILAGLRAGVLTAAATDLKAKDPLNTRTQRLAFLSTSLQLRPSKDAINELIYLGFPLEEEDDEWLYDVLKSKAGSPVFYGAKLLLGLRALYDGNEELSKEYLDEAQNLGPGMAIVSQMLKATMVDDSTENPSEVQQAPSLGGIYMILGSHSVVKKDFERGKEFFRKAMELNPKSPAARNNLAVCISNAEGVTTQQLEEARELVTSAIELQPTVSNYFESRGAIELKLGHYKESIQDLERAMAMGYPNQVSVWRKLAKACRALGRDKEADAYIRALETMGEGLEESATPTDGSDDLPDDASLEDKSDDSPADDPLSETGASTSEQESVETEGQGAEGQGAEGAGTEGGGTEGAGTEGNNGG